MFELPGDVDHGEAILATVGVHALIKGKQGRVTADEWRRIERIGTRCDDLARQLVNGEINTSKGPTINYDKMLDAFAESMSPEALDEILAEIPLPLHDSISAFVNRASAAWQYLESKFPISVVRTVTGSVNLPPSDFALGIFEDLLQAVDEPLSVYETVAVGRITSDQALALQTLYPTLYARIVAGIVKRIMWAKTEDPEWFCDWERGLAVLLAVPGLDPSIKNALAIPPDQQPQTKQAPPRPPAAATNVATASQKVDAQLQGR